MLIFSWADSHPNSLVWDPAIGISEQGAASAMFIAPAVALVAVLAALL
jgi:hypothetical protein